MAESIVQRLLSRFASKEPEPSAFDTRLRQIAGDAPPAKAEPPTDIITIEEIPERVEHDTLQFVAPLPQAPVVSEDAEALVEIRGFVMSQLAGLEIGTVSKEASDCVDFAMSKADGVGYHVTVTLRMKPQPQAIEDAVDAMQAICSQLGGKAAGWALKEQRLAA
ncbi:MAG: hypothetical protein U1E46_11405 [Hyphomicrobiales bacterium]